MNCPDCGKPMKSLGLWPDQYKREPPAKLAETFICETCPKHGPPPGAYTTTRILTDRDAEFAP